MREYYQTLETDLVDTYELKAFRVAYAKQREYLDAVAKAKMDHTPPPPPLKFDPALTNTEEDLLAENRRTYDALAARVHLAQAMQDAYDSYGHLNQYNAAEEVQQKMNGLSAAVGAAANAALTGSGAIVTGLLKDAAAELATDRQNRDVRALNQRLSDVLEKLQKVFDSEKPIYRSIAAQRADEFREVAQKLVSSEAVISSSMVSRVLGEYDFNWPEPQRPFTDPAIKSGIVKMIELRAHPIAQLTADAADGLSSSLSNLVALHKQLANRGPLPLSAALEKSATVQAILDRLKGSHVPVDMLTSLFKSLSKGGTQ